MTNKTSLVVRPSEFITWPMIIGFGVAFLLIIVMIAITSQVSLFTAVLIYMTYPLAIVIYKLSYLPNSIQVAGNQLSVIDYMPKYLVKTNSMQRIDINDIELVYYLEKEILFLKFLRDKFKKYHIPWKENNYSPEHLIRQYNVSAVEIKELLRKYQKRFDDSRTGGIYVLLELFYGRYHIQKEIQKKITNNLKKDENFNYHFLCNILQEYSISTEDMLNLEDEFALLEKDVALSYCLTKVNIKRHVRMKQWPANQAFSTLGTDLTLVFTSHDGTKKVYLRHFQYLKKEDKSSLFKFLHEKQPSIQYLLPRDELVMIMKEKT
jgi:hypothetical protein